MQKTWRKWIFFGPLAALLALTGPARAAEQRILIDPTQPLDDETWQHLSFGPKTEYTRTTKDGVAAFHAVGRQSTSGLYHAVDFDPIEWPVLRWRWRAEELHESVDIRDAATEDFGLALFIMFGRPSIFNFAPTLAYVWTSETEGLAEGDVVNSPRVPNRWRSIVVREGPNPLQEWVTEERNLVADFRRAYGREPPGNVKVIAIFTDNDQTGHPVEAYYGPITAHPEGR